MHKTKKVHFRALKKQKKRLRRSGCAQKDTHFVYNVTNYVKKRGPQWFI